MVRKLAALLSLLMVLLGGPAGGAFTLCLGEDGHLAIEAAQARHHDRGAVSGGALLSAEVDCTDVPLLRSAPPIVKQQVSLGSDVALPVSSASWALTPNERQAVSLAFPKDGPSLDPRLVLRRSVVLLI